MKITANPFAAVLCCDTANDHMVVPSSVTSLASQASLRRKRAISWLLRMFCIVARVIKTSLRPKYSLPRVGSTKSLLSSSSSSCSKSLAAACSSLWTYLDCSYLSIFLFRGTMSFWTLSSIWILCFTASFCMFSVGEIFLG